MSSDRLVKQDLAAYASKLDDVGYEVVDALWRRLEDDLGKYADRQGWPHLDMWSAESGRSLTDSRSEPYLRNEGVAFGKWSLRQLPLLPYHFFGNRDVYDLYRHWINTLKG